MAWYRLWIWKSLSLILYAWKENLTKYRYEELSGKKKVNDTLATLELPDERTNAEYHRKLLREHIKTIWKSKLESRRNCFWQFPEKGNWSFSNCWLKPMVRCMLIRKKHWKIHGEMYSVGLQSSLYSVKSNDRAW